MHCPDFRQRAVSLYFDRGLSLPRVAEAVSLHPDYLNRCFRHWGVTLRTEKQRRAVRSVWERYDVRESLFLKTQWWKSPRDDKKIKRECLRLGVSPAFLHGLWSITYLRNGKGSYRHFKLFDVEVHE